MASVVDICNGALNQLGASTILTLTEDSKNARLCNARYTQVRDSLFRSHLWNCLTKRVELLKGLDFEICREVADSLPIMTGARQTCKILKDAGWKIMAVSGGFTIMTDRLKDELNLDHIYTNELIFKDGKLDGVKINVDSDKAKSARIKIEEWNIPKDEIVVIVDGANDIKLFDICNLGIAYRAQDLVKDLATISLEEKNLAKIIPIINQHYSMKLPLPISS